jgi:Ca2+:H+ antiporter
METVMTVACLSLIIPTTVTSSLLQSDHPEDDNKGDILTLSHGTSIFLLILFSAYLYFQLTQSIFLDISDPGHFTIPGPDNTAVGTSYSRTTSANLTAVVHFLLITTLTVVHSFHLVRTIDPLAQHLSVSKSFISIVIVPFAGNIAKWIDLLRRSRLEPVRHLVRTIMGTTVQISLLALPLLTAFGWILNVPITLDFDIFESVILFLATLVMNSITQDGKATYFEGAMLMGS